ncbi:Beta-lactamase superfamily domain protein [uncultured archaeon]|nr:Beta-lactamase superfamily domain protein [uncultured archaeon]
MLTANGRTAYIDPFRLRDDNERADLIFITHPHYDHLSHEDIDKIADKNTKFVAPKDAKDRLEKGDVKEVLYVDPGKSYAYGGLRFRTVPAYNVKPDRLSFHPRAKGWVGYVIEADNAKVYHAGDTDLTPELKGADADIALIPMGGTYTMDVKEAIEAANSMKARKVAPMHYREHYGRSGYKTAEATFLDGAKNGVILDQVQAPYFPK